MAEPTIYVVLRADRVRSIVSHTTIALGVPIWLLVALAGHGWIAAILWGLGFALVYRVEHWFGNKLRAYLISTEQALPEWLSRPYVVSKRVVIQES